MPRLSGTLLDLDLGPEGNLERHLTTFNIHFDKSSTLNRSGAPTPSMDAPQANTVLGGETGSFPTARGETRPLCPPSPHR